MNPRLKALADALEKHYIHESDDEFYDPEFSARCREGSALIRSLSDVEPALTVFVDGYCTKVYTEHQRLPDGMHTLYLHPTEHSGSVLQAPAEGVAALVASLRENIIVDAFTDGRITSGALAERLIRERLNAADAIDARANVSSKEPVEQRGEQDEKSTREGVERDAARYRWLRMQAFPWGSGCWKSYEALDGACDAAIDAQIKTGEAPQ